MGVEIERKFLLANDGWRSAVISTDHFIDGLLARTGRGKIRVRQGGEKAWLTIKGPRGGISRSEFEYEIPMADAQELISTLCEGPTIQKVRHVVPYAHLLWSIDIHAGVLAGIEFAEVELLQPTEVVPLPPWVGEEITHDMRFRKETLLKRCAEAAQVCARADRSKHDENVAGLRHKKLVGEQALLSNPSSL